MIEVEVAVGLLGVVVALLGGIGALGVRLASDLAGLRAENRRLWVWARALVDYSYRYRRPDAPDLPPVPNLDDD